jgi:hypothetical protein
MKQHQNIRAQGLWGLVRRHPIPSILGVWVTLLLLAGLSAATLLHIDAETKLTKTPQEPPTPDAPSAIALSQYPMEQPGSSAAVPLVSFGAIALTCTLGCLALSRTVRPVAAQRQAFQNPESQKKISVAQLKNSERSRAASQIPQGSPEVLEENHEQVEQVTQSVVVPKQQNHPLDWDEPSLADSLDMRQRRPLSHWL